MEPILLFPDPVPPELAQALDLAGYPWKAAADEAWRQARDALMAAFDADRRADLVTETLVLAEVSVDELQGGAQLSRPVARHAARHPESLRLVRARQHHPATDGDGLAPQLGVQQLLDRGVERVEVGVEDGGAGVHGALAMIEHLFDHGKRV